MMKVLCLLACLSMAALFVTAKNTSDWSTHLYGSKEEDWEWGGEEGVVMLTNRWENRSYVIDGAQGGMNYSAARMLCSDMDHEVVIRRSSRVQRVVIDSGELWVLAHLNCSQNDEDLGDCVNTTAATLVNFPGVNRMNVSTLSCTDELPVKLVGGSELYEGRVEVFTDGEWGSVCDDSWDLLEGTVVCRQLGYGNTTVVVPQTGVFGRGSTTSKIFMDDLKCNGDEASLIDCKMSPLEDHNCDHDEDAAVICKAPGEVPSTESPPHSLHYSTATIYPSPRSKITPKATLYPSPWSKITPKATLYPSPWSKMTPKATLYPSPWSKMTPKAKRKKARNVAAAVVLSLVGSALLLAMLFIIAVVVYKQCTNKDDEESDSEMHEQLTAHLVTVQEVEEEDGGMDQERNGAVLN